MTTTRTGTYDEALERLHRTGPEWDGWMSNHGPMAVDVLARRDAGGDVHAWVDDYARRLEELPTERRPLRTADDEREALGDAARLGDWIAHFERLVEAAPWEDVLATWWPRLLPGIAAGATHGVIRTGHATMALRAEDNEVRRAELAQALGYWAGRWQPVPMVALHGTGDAASLVGGVPRIASQEGGIRDRLARLDAIDTWPEHVGAMRPPTDVPRALDQLVDVAVALYPVAAHGNPTMLVHAATAPPRGGSHAAVAAARAVVRRVRLRLVGHGCGAVVLSARDVRAHGGPGRVGRRGQGARAAARGRARAQARRRSARRARTHGRPGCGRSNPEGGGARCVSNPVVDRPAPSTRAVAASSSRRRVPTRGRRSCRAEPAALNLPR